MDYCIITERKLWDAGLDVLRKSCQKSRSFARAVVRKSEECGAKIATLSLSKCVPKTLGYAFPKKVHLRKLTTFNFPLATLKSQACVRLHDKSKAEVVLQRFFNLKSWLKK